MSDLDTIRRLHQPVRGDAVCDMDGEEWPCDTRVVLHALDNMTDQRNEWMSVMLDRERQRGAASADADRLAEALGSDDDGYCRECRRMVCQWDERSGYPGELYDRLDLHADDCKTREALRQHDATTKNETDAPLNNPSDTGIDEATPCDCGTVDCAKAALDSVVVGHVPPFDTIDKGERP